MKHTWRCTVGLALVVACTYSHAEPPTYVFHTGAPAGFVVESYYGIGCKSSGTSGGQVHVPALDAMNGLKATALQVNHNAALNVTLTPINDNGRLMGFVACGDIATIREVAPRNREPTSTNPPKK